MNYISLNVVLVCFFCFFHLLISFLFFFFKKKGTHHFHQEQLADALTCFREAYSLVCIHALEYKRGGGFSEKVEMNLFSRFQSFKLRIA